MTDTVYEKLGSHQARITDVEQDIKDVKDELKEVKELLQDLRDDARARHKVWVWVRNGSVIIASIAAAAEANIQGWFK